jgi:hypothetical protein
LEIWSGGRTPGLLLGSLGVVGGLRGAGLADALTDGGAGGVGSMATTGLATSALAGAGAGAGGATALAAGAGLRAVTPQAASASKSKPPATIKATRSRRCVVARGSGARCRAVCALWLGKAGRAASVARSAMRSRRRDRSVPHSSSIHSRTS